MAAALAVYIFGIIFGVVAIKRIKIDIRAISLVLTVLAVTAMGIMQNISNDYLALFPVFFAMPVQWIAFRTAAGYDSATIFCSNNLRIAVTATAGYAMEKDEKQLKKAKFYWLTLISFMAGAAVSAVATMFFGAESIWAAFLPITAACIAYLRLIHSGVIRLRRKVMRALAVR